MILFIFFVVEKAKIDFLVFRFCIYIVASPSTKSKMSVKVQILYGFLFVILLLNAQNNYGVRADDKNITRLLNNQVIVSRQIMCVLDKSPCDQLGRQLKGIFFILRGTTSHFYMNYLFIDFSSFRFVFSLLLLLNGIHLESQANQSINGNGMFRIAFTFSQSQIPWEQ